MPSDAATRERNDDRCQLDEDRAGTEAKKRGLKGGVPFGNSEGAISATNRGTGLVSWLSLFSIIYIIPTSLNVASY